MNYKCADCLFFEASAGERAGLGFCHRYPPSVYADSYTEDFDRSVVLRTTPAQTFPDVVGHQWCGEFRDRP